VQKSLCNSLSLSLSCFANSSPMHSCPSSITSPFCARVRALGYFLSKGGLLGLESGEKVILGCGPNSIQFSFTSF
jgi:hypothetical protein